MGVFAIPQRGLVPALKYSDDSIKDEVITESSVASHFLADLGPSHLLPAQASGSKTALAKARSNFFVDTYVTKLLPKYHAFVFAADGSGPDAKTKDYLDTLEREIEPLLKDANPFFGGSQELTLTEVREQLQVLER